MKDLIICFAKEDDVVNIASLINQWLRIEKQSKRVNIIHEALQNENHEILVAELNSKIVGVLHFTIFTDIMFGDYNSHILFLLVKEEHRRKGIGVKLLHKAIERAKEKGAVEIHVDTKSKEAEAFYKKEGFNDDGVMLERNL